MPNVIRKINPNQLQVSVSFDQDDLDAVFIDPPTLEVQALFYAIDNDKAWAHQTISQRLANLSKLAGFVEAAQTALNLTGTVGPKP